RIISDATGLPASTSIRSAIRALAHLGVRNVAVLSPYPQVLHRSALTFLAASGFEVVADHTMDVVFKRLQDVTPAQIAAQAERVLASAPSAEGLYVPCNQWSAADAAPLIEGKCGLPVVTGSHADHWEAFRTLGIDDRIDGHGRLMASLAGAGRRAPRVGRDGGGGWRGRGRRRAGRPPCRLRPARSDAAADRNRGGTGVSVATGAFRRALRRRRQR